MRWRNAIRKTCTRKEMSVSKHFSSLGTRPVVVAGVAAAASIRRMDLDFYSLITFMVRHTKNEEKRFALVARFCLLPSTDFSRFTLPWRLLTLPNWIDFVYGTFESDVRCLHAIDVVIAQATPILHHTKIKSRSFSISSERDVHRHTFDKTQAESTYTIGH